MEEVSLRNCPVGVPTSTRSGSTGFCDRKPLIRSPCQLLEPLESMALLDVVSWLSGESGVGLGDLWPFR